MTGANILAMRFAPEAWPFVAPFPLLATVLAARGHRKSALGALAAGAAVLLFFRHPERRFDGPADVVVAAADGIVTGVDTIPTSDFAHLGPEPCRRVITFLSAFDVHVQTAPVTGTVVYSRLDRGRKVAAFLPHADEVNEASLTIIRRPGGDRVGVRQIAGLMARRVVSDLVAGQDVERGKRLGIIKFGSRVDLIFPTSYEVLVERGGRLRAGETPVAIAHTA